jgi:pimeloyl-ACP methyl ester carboxylesterase
MQRSLPECQTFCLDLPGIGDQRTRNAPWSTSAMACDVAERWRRLKSRRAGTWGLLGISLGGMVALDLCAQLPRAWAAAVLINTSSALSPAVDRMNLGALTRLLRASVSTEKLEESILQLTTNLRKPDQDLLLQERLAWATAKRIPHTAVFQHFYAARAFLPPERLLTPLLFLASRGDRLVSASCTERLANFYDAPARVHPSAGHDLPLDDPSWVLGRIRDWALRDGS